MAYYSIAIAMYSTPKVLVLCIEKPLRGFSHSYVMYIYIIGLTMYIVKPYVHV
jgi:hypothetical protein